MQRRSDLTTVRRWSALTALICALASCASDPDRGDPRDRGRIDRLVSTLVAQGDADSFAAAALLEYRGSTTRRLELMTQAASLAPDRPALAWLHVAICHQVPTCDAGPLEARLAAVDPQNGVASFGAIQRSTAGNDPASLARALSAVAQSERVDLYWGPLIHDLTLAVDRTHQWPVSEAMTSVTGILAGESIPPLSSVSNACKGPALESPDRVETCRGVARALMRGDTLVVEMIGFAIGKRVWTADSPEGAQLRSDETIARYRMNEAAKLNEPANASRRAVMQFLDDLVRYRSEEEMNRAQLARAGLPTEPPVATGFATKP